MSGMDNVIQGAWAVLFIGIIIFAINIVLTLNYTSYASTRNTLITNYGASSGVVSNYSTYAGQNNATYSSNLNIVIVALVLIVILLAVLLGISAARGSISGGTLK